MRRKKRAEEGKVVHVRIPLSLDAMVDAELERQQITRPWLCRADLVRELLTKVLASEKTSAAHAA